MAHRDQLKRLCSSQETFEKSQSILRLVTAKTRPGSGFVVKNPVAIPAICAYLASEQLNTGEVSHQSAMAAVCVSKSEFNDTLKTIRAALRSEEGKPSVDVTYETLVNAYHIHPGEDAKACMEDTEAALSPVDMLKERYGANTLSCAVFYWVCQLMEEPSVQERALCQTYSLHQKTFKAVLTTLDKQCEGIADQIKSCLLERRRDTQSSHPTTKKTSTPAKTPSKKRTVTFTRLSSKGNRPNDDNLIFPETPTKKRRIDTPSPDKASMRRSPVKHPSTAAFHAALKGSPIKHPTEQESESQPLTAGPSTPHRPRHTKVVDVTTTPVRADAQPSPSRSQGQASPTRHRVRRRFRPVFLEQEQWCAQDPKVQRMWAAVVIPLCV